MVGGEHSLKMSAVYLLRFGCKDVLKVWRKRVTQVINQLISNIDACRTAPAKLVCSSYNLDWLVKGFKEVITITKLDLN